MPKQAERNAAADNAAFEALLKLDTLVKGGRVAANWLPDGRFWFVEGAPVDTQIKVFDPKTRKTSDMFDVAALRATLAAKLGRALPYEGLPFEAFHFSGANVIQFSVEGTDYLYNLTDGALTALDKPSFAEAYFGVDPRSRVTPQMMHRPNVFPDSGAVPEPLSPDGRRFASLKNGDIWIRSVVDGRYDRLTHDAEPDFGWDVESTRAGVSSAGVIMYLTVNPWSPDSGRLYATRFDAREVGKLHRIRYLRHFDEVESARMARSGDTLQEAQPYVFSIFSGQRVRIDVDARDAFVLLLGWSEAGRVCITSA